MKENIKFHDIYDFYFVPFYKEWWFILLMTLFFLGAIAAGVYYFLQWRARKREEIIKITPVEWATRELKKLSVDSCATKNDYKKFYFKLTEIIKEYIFKQYGWRVQDKTDEELISFLWGVQFDSELIMKLDGILKGSLLVKFAGEDALKDAARNALEVAFFIIGNK
jgi:hypothetical protein